MGNIKPITFDDFVNCMGEESEQKLPDDIVNDLPDDIVVPECPKIPEFDFPKINMPELNVNYPPIVFGPCIIPPLNWIGDKIEISGPNGINVDWGKPITANNLDAQVFVDCPSKFKTNKKIAIIGYGYVGQAMYKFFSTHYHTVIYDELKCYGTKEQANACDVAIVCVPTPSDEKGNCDTSIVESVVDWVQCPLVIVKSTVAPKTTDRLKEKTGKRVVFSPEYCGESSYWSPYKFHTEVKETPWFIFGGDKKDTSECVSLYLPIVGPTKVYKQTTALEAELAKYAENCFYASKITFCYEMANICKQAGADWNEVREVWLLDERINKMHTAVFEENDKCYGGKCLPKDLAALIAFAESLGYDAQFLKEVEKSNKRIGEFRKENRKG